ncbi:MAG: hypothetical protein M3P31_01780 [Actinomycetota bacterium]|nr:hypothetical protein [Actinomycetota bacterium]
MTNPDGKTPSAPDVDQPDGGAHGGESEAQAAGRTAGAPDVDQPDGGGHAGDTPTR